MTPYTQVFLECGSENGMVVRRVLQLKNPARGVAQPADPNREVKLTHNFAYNGESSRHVPGKGDYSDPDNQHGSWAEMPLFGPVRAGYQGRFILRPNEVHCASDVQHHGVKRDNPRLGTYGRVWVRDSTQMLSQIGFPRSLPGEGALFVSGIVRCSACCVTVFGARVVGKLTQPLPLVFCSMRSLRL